MQAAATKVVSPPSPLHIPSADPRGSIIAVSPGISSALNYMRMGDQDKDQDKTNTHKADNSDREKGEQKEAWRKSDSTMSHHTIRPGAAPGTRASRPVSMAESLQSIHTIVPVNKRLSALISDADFATPEEEPSSTSPALRELVTPPKSSPTNSLKARNRRSMSLNLGPTFAKIYVPPSSATAAVVSDAKYSSKSFDETHPRLPPSVLQLQETPTLTRAAANGIISPSSPGLQSTGNNIRGRLAAWSATNTALPSQRSLPPPPPRHSPANSSPSRHSPTPPPSSRQPTVSMTGGFGLAKRAVEKMNRAWGGFSSGSSNSSSSSTAPSSYSDHNLARISSNQSGLGRNGKKSRRTPDAPSGAWSVNSATSSISDSDVFMTPPGPYLGKQLRGPMRTKSGGGGGGAVGGIVFGRDLKSVTRETAVGVGVQFSAADLDRVLGPDRIGIVDKNHLQMLEKRMLPAIVVRCAQHLLLWGIQEEGLFRVSGRPSHVNKLRADFDTGADFDMTECSPGELDPHAVASVFKAFLRELPEPILTHALLPYFEAALTQENASNPQASSASTGARVGGRGPTLPSGPRIGLRKPPSLSTLAMPSFAGMRPPSRSLINAFKSLLSQLPPENKDLIRTVTELIKATAIDSKATKMPLSNLLLVFCPSLNMNPPLLKILCEAEDIWDAMPLDSPVLDIKRESVILDISAPSTAQPLVHDSHRGIDANTPVEEERPSLEKGERPLPSANSFDRTARARPMGPRRHVPAAVFGESVVSFDDSTHRSVSPRSIAATSSDTKSISDDVSSHDSISEGHSMTSPLSRLGVSSPPPLSSSSESLVTPSSSSANPSLTDIPFINDPYMKPEPVTCPIIASSSDLALNMGNISGPVQFPLSDESDQMAVPSPRRSIPLISLPGRCSNPPSPSGSLPGSPRRRLKKPSLTLLFSKRSASSLTSSPGGRPYISSPYLQTSASDSSISTPISAITAPQSHSPKPVPVLDTTIESPSLRLSMGLDASPPSETLEHQIEHPNPPEALSDAPSLSARSGPTPIADHYRSVSTTTLPILSPGEQPSHLRPKPTRNASNASVLSTASSNHLGILDDDEDQEDWTQSVLMAADADGPWTLPYSTTK
ncbi:RhoGAP-domain-containing protein [Hymenopellis radicata]|nr:RhoGAP-domain-containing protein [Hymenopellis radicata]